MKQLGIGISIISLVPPQLSVPIGQLASEHIHTAKQRIQATLIKAGISTFIGGIDISANEHKREFDPHFQLQAWILAPTDQIRPAESKLRAAIPKTSTVPRPVKIKLWDRNLAALGYALKDHFVRRVSYQREANEDGSKHTCRNTRDRPLRVEQHIELAITLDQAGLQARLILGGCRVVRTVNGPMIRPITKRQHDSDDQ
ncbi:hypothetical protein [Microvirga aerophila]|uniref:hypothetical protein n=1 Tax=Microvirga aerophila TaxID=670291 RepID=UPI0011BE2C1C|nr:hypothetical protein [Microvirga aerophila]